MIRNVSSEICVNVRVGQFLWVPRTVSHLLVFSGDAEYDFFDEFLPSIEEGTLPRLLLLRPIELLVFSKTYGRMLDAFLRPSTEASKG